VVMGVCDAYNVTHSYDFVKSPGPRFGDSLEIFTKSAVAIWEEGTRGTWTTYIYR